jgi:hypothetical protein
MPPTIFATLGTVTSQKTLRAALSIVKYGRTAQCSLLSSLWASASHCGTRLSGATTRNGMSGMPPGFVGSGSAGAPFTCGGISVRGHFFPSAHG